MKNIIVIALVLFMAIGASAAWGDDAVVLEEWPVPWENTRPRDPYVDPSDRVWFVGQKGDYLAYFVPSSQEFKRYDLPWDTGPHNLIVDDNGMVWFAANDQAYIGKLDPESGNISKYPMPGKSVKDPHTLIFDQKGDIWFTAQQGNAVGKLTMETGAIQLIPVPTPRARPYGIVMDKGNRPWIALLGTNKLATVDPETMKLEEVALPRAETRPRRLAADSKGRIWYVDYAQGYLGRYDPVSGDVKEWPTPNGGSSQPYGVAIDNLDRLWFVEGGPDPNLFVGFNPATEEFFSKTEIGSGGGSVRHMYYHPPSRTIWFGTDTNTLGRAALQ